MTTWMIVEDEPDIYEMLLAMSEVLGNEGVAFVDGDEAIAWVEEVDAGRFDGELPELALLDIRLPTNISGPMVGERLRKSPVIGQLGLVLMTAYRLSDEDAQTFIDQAGADLLLTKPLPSMGELQKKLADVVAKRAAMQLEKASVPESTSPPASAPKPAPPSPPPTSTTSTPATPPSTSKPSSPQPPATPPKPTT